MKKAATAFLLVIILFSCNKETYPDRKGEYDWTSSESTTGGDVTDLFAPGDRYGIHIKKNGKVLFYKNGKIRFKGKITGIYEDEFSTGTSIFADRKSYYLSRDHNGLCQSNYPFEQCYNYYTYNKK